MQPHKSSQQYNQGGIILRILLYRDDDFGAIRLYDDPRRVKINPIEKTVKTYDDGDLLEEFALVKKRLTWCDNTKSNVDDAEVVVKLIVEDISK